MTNQILKIQVELLDYWHVGSGHGRGTHLDAIVDRDSNNLPYVPGRMLKGLLRNAAHCLVQWGRFDTEALENMFGNENLAGAISVSDARLPGEVTAYLAGDEQTHLREQLFAEHFTTAIEQEGSAKDRSLRGIELAIPCTLFAELEIPVDVSQELVKQALLLVRSLGAHRSRGLGRCILSVVGG